MQKSFTEQEVHEGGGHVARLVQGKGEALRSEFEDLLRNPGWLLKIMEEHPAVDDLPSLAMLLVGCNAVGFTRRVIWQTRRLRYLSLPPGPGCVCPMCVCAASYRNRRSERVWSVIIRSSIIAPAVCLYRRSESQKVWWGVSYFIRFPFRLMICCREPWGVECDDRQRHLDKAYAF